LHRDGVENGRNEGIDGGNLDNGRGQGAQPRDPLGIGQEDPPPSTVSSGYAQGLVGHNNAAMLLKCQKMISQSKTAKTESMFL
jgi:hypothetical protein